MRITTQAKAATNRRILESAARLFRAAGWEDTTTRQIAIAAGIANGRIEAAGAKALSTGQAELLGRGIIHSVTNPIPRLISAIHVYGGDFFAAGRSEWDPDTLMERPYDAGQMMRRFKEANAMR